MQQTIPLYFCIALILASCAGKKVNTSANEELAMKKTVLTEPKTEKIPTKLEKFGDIRIDNYFWLREKTNPKVIEHLKEENAYMQAKMADTKKLQEQLYAEMRARVKEDDQTVPYKKGNYFYYSKTLKGQEYPIYCRRRGSMNAPEEIMIDVNELAKNKDSITVTGLKLHSNEQLLAYAVDEKGDRVFNVYFKDLSTGKVFDFHLEKVTSNFEWAEKGKILFFAQQEEKTLRMDRIYRLDFDAKKSELVFTEKDDKFDTYVYKTLTKKYIMIGSSSKLTSEIRYIPSDEPYAAFKIFHPREAKHEYSVADGGDRFFIRTNWKAKNFRIMEVGLNKTAKRLWRDVVPHKKDVYIEDFEAFKNHLVISERKGGLTQIQVLRRGRKRGDYITFPDPAYMVGMGNNAEYDANLVRYEFTSMSRPTSTYDYNVQEKTSKLLKEKEVPGYVSSNYVTERAFAKAKDGTKIPISIVYRKRTKIDGTAPLLIYGYGSYGINMDPWFSSSKVSLLDRGFVFALAHIRGGSEMGRAWYDDGKFLKKKNTFNDFIACTEFLVKNKYADPKKVYANGGSAGGLLMGAVMNLRPDLYHGIVADVPFVDVLSTMLDSTLPLTTGEYEEWGNPNDKKYYNYMKSYSPYDNVSEKDYPHLLVTTGLNDSQVSYWEPAKWVAKLRDMRTDKSKLLLMKIQMEVGHQGKSGRFETLKEVAMEYAFFLKLEGIRL